MLLADPYASIHVWYSLKSSAQYLKKLKEISGIEPKKGRWSDSEVKQLKENMKLYQNLNPDVNIIKLLFERRNVERTRIFKETRVWDILAYGLCRIINSIILTIKHYYMKHAGFKTGVYSKQEYSYLKELVAKHGHDWALISTLMNRSTGSLCPTYHHSIKNCINRGPWHHDEKERFFHITKILIQYNQQQGSPLYKFKWPIVSDFVKTRSEHSCRKFAKANEFLFPRLLVQNDFTHLFKEAMVLYLYFTKIQFQVEIDFKELVFLFDGKFKATELREEFKKMIPVLTNGNFKEEIKSQYKKEIKGAKSMFQRINFTNVVESMKRPRTISWMKTKYFLLVKENISEYENKTSEDIISILHEQYCSDHTFENKRDTSEQEACISDSNEVSIQIGIHRTTIPSIDLMSDDEDERELVDLTLIADGDNDVIDDNDDAYNITDVMIID